jgi:hypothetical protein
MQRKPTLSERILGVVSASLVAAWCLLVLTISLGYQGTTASSTWIIRCLLLSAGALLTTTFLRAAAGAWQAAVSRPLHDGRTSSWLAGQPAWRLAIYFWLLYSAPELGVSLWLHHGRPPGAALQLYFLITSVIGASLVTMLYRTLWRRQLENRLLLAEAATPSR